MSVDASFAVNGPARLGHSITDAAAGDPAVCVIQFCMLGPASRQAIWPGVQPACLWPLLPAVEVMVDLEAPDDMVLSLGFGQADLTALIDYLTGVQRNWQTGNYR